MPECIYKVLELEHIGQSLFCGLKKIKHRALIILIVCGWTGNKSCNVFFSIFFLSFYVSLKRSVEKNKC